MVKLAEYADEHNLVLIPSEGWAGPPRSWLYRGGYVRAGPPGGELAAERAPAGTRPAARRSGICTSAALNPPPPTPNWWIRSYSGSGWWRQAKLAAKGDDEAMRLDEDYPRAMEYGMPPQGGMGMGIDRLLKALTGPGIRETILIPLVRPE
jgi:hypothetical protein